MSNITLYEMSTQYQMLLQRLSDADLDTTTITDTIEASGIMDDITLKAQGYEFVARALEQYTPAIDAEIARLQALKAGRVKKAQGLRQYLLTNMIACGIVKIDSPLFKIRIQNNPPSVDVYEPRLVASQYMRKPPVPPLAPDKDAIKGDLQRGMDVQGCRLVQSQRLVVT